MSSTKDKSALRITDQHRGKQGMVYDLKSEGSRLTLTIVAEADDRWRIEARTGKEEEPLVAEADTTRRGALARVAASWRMRSGLPPFDWDAVTTALADVRAV
jgi:hypothetical protein